MKAKFFVLFIILFFIPIYVFSINTGGRASGFMGCYSSISDDASAVFWNPAGMYQLSQKNTELFASIFDTFTATAFSFVYPWENIGYLGLGVYKQNNFELEESQEISANVSYARNINSNTSVGITLKDIQRTKDNSSDSGLNANIGIMHKPIRNISLALTAENILSKELNYSNQKYKMPSNYRFGLTYYFIMWREKLQFEKYLQAENKNTPVSGENVLLSIDIEKNEAFDNFLVYRGIEFWINDFFAFRMGPQKEQMRPGHYWDCFFALNNPIIGLSLKYKDIRFDISYNRDVYPTSIAFNYKFGKKAASSGFNKWEIEKQAQQYYRTGEEYYNQGKLAQALIEWDKALIWQPGNDGLQNKVNETQKEFEVETNKKLIENFINEAYLAYGDGKLLDSLDKWEEILKLDPENKRAQEYIEKINSKLTESEKRNHSSKNAQKQKLELVDHLRKGDIYFEREKYNDAIKEWKSIIELNPQDTEAKGNIARAEKKIVEAVNEHFNSGLDLYKKDDFTKASAEFRKVIEFNPQHSEAIKYLEEIRNKSARKTSLNRIDELYYTAADLYFNGKYDESVRILNELLGIDPLNKNALKLFDKVKSVMEKLGK